MRDYGSVSPRFWIGETGKKLRGDRDAQLLALYLMTSPHANMIGVFHCPIPYMAHETGLPVEVVEKTMGKLAELDFCQYDEVTETVFVVRMSAHQVGENLKAGDKKILGIRKEWERIASPILKKSYYEMYKDSHSLSPFEGACKGLESSKEAPPKQLTGTGTGTGTEIKNSCASVDARTRPRAQQNHHIGEGFCRFWAAYPKKKSKGDAEKAWGKIKPDEQLTARIIAAVEQAKTQTEWRKEGGQFIPYPATWLNAKRWEDEAIVTVPPPRPERKVVF